MNDVRRSPRRLSNCRRKSDRRIVHHPFGSEEWEANIQINYLAWPKTDRRETHRRSIERREYERRQQLSQQLQSFQKYSSLVLTREELRMIEQLYKSDLD